MSQNLEKRLTLALEKLEVGLDKVKKTRPYDRQQAKLRILSEMIKEQYNHENSRSTASSAR